MKTLSLTSSLLLLLFLKTGSLFAQRLNPGAGADLTISGNGHGEHLGANISFISEKNFIEITPLLQTSVREFNSIRVSAGKAITQNGHARTAENRIAKKFRSWLTFAAEYHHKAPLAMQVLSYETSIESPGQENNRAPLLNTIQVTAGISPEFRIFQTIAIRCSFSAGFYRHMNVTMRLNHKTCAPVFSTGVGISFIKATQ